MHLERKALQLLLAGLGCIALACNDRRNESAAAEPAAGPALFTLLPPDQTGVSFSNTLTEGLNTNLLMYEYFYNGGGVAVGDVNGDGLQDLYFTGNMVDNRLYLNRGNLRFEDITAAAGVAGRQGPWKTGVTMADVNGDGLLDIYVCYSGNLRAEKRTNQLFINQGWSPGGLPSFSEQAAAYGLADSAYSTQGYFFDADRDNDLDLLLLNHNPRSLPVLDSASTTALLKKHDPLHGTKLFRNDGNRFRDITPLAGLNHSPLSYGLGAGIADLNGDGWSDMYISNDYTVPDYLYINRGDGTFHDTKKEALGHTSHFSMGNDVSDVNNDGLPDIFVLDMLPEDNQRQKLLMAPDNYEKFELNLKSGFHYQYMRNMLQVNNGNGTFSEVAQLSGISNTDWSWAPLFSDYDNDGWKDLFVTNGYVRDYTNLDFLKFMGDYVQNREEGLMRQAVLDLVHRMPSSQLVNYIFQNKGDGTFRKMGAQWGIGVPSNSNGAAYADLDNDGDQDLVVNNINQPAFVYRNEARQQQGHHFLQVELKGSRGNTQGVGARLWLYANGKQQYQEQMPARGYQSSVSPVLHFGLGTGAAVDSLRIVWPDGKHQLVTGIRPDQRLVVEAKNAGRQPVATNEAAPYFAATAAPLPFHHGSIFANDFKRQPLMVHPMSFFGPCLLKGDVNGDGLEDVYAGGGAGQPGALYLQQRGGQFTTVPNADFERDKLSEDADAAFLDANGDGLVDLYVASGGYHNFLPDDSALQDRLYLGNGKGGFSRLTGALPSMRVSKACVRVADMDADGDPDLFVGGRVVPGRYPETPASYLLLNDGKGQFRDATNEVAPGLRHMGMVSDAAWMELNGDGRPDLVVAGAWMPVSAFTSSGSQLHNKTKDYFGQEYRGWWNRISVGDFNADGREDLVIGNEGLNTQCKVSSREPADLYYKDFDENGAVDPILCFYIQGKSYPYVFRDELLDQISMMRSRFENYKSYAEATLHTIFTPEEMEGAQRLQANYLQTALFERGADGKFLPRPLPLAAQYAPVFTITQLDYNRDGKTDLLLCGNSNQARLRFGKSDANYGLLLEGTGKGTFRQVPQRQSGFRLQGDVRSVLPLGSMLLVGRNREKLIAYKSLRP